MEQTKSCLICRARFRTDKYRPNQRVCSRPQCQRRRQIANMREWRKRHSNYFKGMYPFTKEKIRVWGKNHKGYLKEYRKAHRAEHRDYMRGYMREYRRRLKEKRKSDVPT